MVSEIFLFFLVFLRTVVNECYTSFIQQIDHNCLEKIVDVLVRSNQEYVQDMLANENTMDQEEEEEDEDEEEEDE